MIEEILEYIKEDPVQSAIKAGLVSFWPYAMYLICDSYRTRRDIRRLEDENERRIDF